jgi:hypothetical protein
MGDDATVEPMDGTSTEVDPWSTKGLPFTRTWPIYAGVAAGAVLAVVWLLAGRPAFSFLPVLVVGGCAVGGVAALFVPAGERSARFFDVAYPALLAGVSSQFFGAIGVVATGNDEGGNSANTTFVYFFVMLFFVGFPLLIAKVFQSPKRRLPDAVLATIGEPYPTRRAPRPITVRSEDGTTHRVSVLRGGFLAGIGLPFDPTQVTGIVGDHVVPSGPKQIKASRAAAREQAEAKVATKRRARADAKAAKQGDATDTEPTATGRSAPAATSRTTPKGTSSKKKAPKR